MWMHETNAAPDGRFDELCLTGSVDIDALAVPWSDTFATVADRTAAGGPHLVLVSSPLAAQRITTSIVAAAQWWNRPQTNAQEANVNIVKKNTKDILIYTKTVYQVKVELGVRGNKQNKGGGGGEEQKEHEQKEEEEEDVITVSWRGRSQRPKRFSSLSSASLNLQQ
jgi:hypothetical protein